MFCERLFGSVVVLLLTKVFQTGRVMASNCQWILFVAQLIYANTNTDEMKCLGLFFPPPLPNGRQSAPSLLPKSCLYVQTWLGFCFCKRGRGKILGHTYTMVRMCVKDGAGFLDKLSRDAEPVKPTCLPGGRKGSPERDHLSSYLAPCNSGEKMPCMSVGLPEGGTVCKARSDSIGTHCWESSRHWSCLVLRQCVIPLTAVKPR